LQINFGENTKIGNAQFGDNNTMRVMDNGAVLQNKNWEELQQLLNEKLEYFTPTENAYTVTKEAMKYTQKRDEAGLKGFIRRNKETFFTSVLSDIASSGLILAISRLCS